MKKLEFYWDFIPYKACAPVWKVIQSTAANNKGLYGVRKKDLALEEIFLTPSPLLKRFRPRAQGHGYAIKKPMCHITAVVSVKN